MEAVEFNKLEFAGEDLRIWNLKAEGDSLRVFRGENACLPVQYRGRNVLLPWGDKQNGFCREESLKAGRWRFMSPERVNVVVNLARSNGVWFQVREGICGIVVKGRDGKRVCYVLTRESTHYFKIMTGALRMPVLLNQVI